MGGHAPGSDVATVETVFEAVERLDDAALIEHLDPDVIWRPTGFLTGGREYHGHQGVTEWLAGLRELRERGTAVHTLPTDFQVLDDGRVLVLGSGRLDRDIGPIEQELGWIWELRDGKVTRMTNYLSRAEAREAAREAGG